MHGLILAGGEGSRLAADGVAAPKALVPVGGVPQLVRLARRLEDLGCRSLTCLVREGVDLEPVAADLERLRIPSLVKICRTPSSLHTLVEGLTVIPDGPVFCTMVDTVMRTSDWARLYRGMDGWLAAGADAALAVTPFIDDERPLFATANRDGRVIAIGDRLMHAATVTGGVYGLSPRARAIAHAAVNAGVERMRTFLRALVLTGYDVRAVEIATIIDLDRRRDLELANAWQDSCEEGGAPRG
jgi:NDP-sugar pyrophosphorylase family protein